MLLLVVRTKRAQAEHLEDSLLRWINTAYHAFFLRVHLDSKLQQIVALLQEELAKELQYDLLAEELLA